MGSMVSGEMSPRNFSVKCTWAGFTHRRASEHLWRAACTSAKDCCNVTGGVRAINARIMTRVSSGMAHRLHEKVKPGAGTPNTDDRATGPRRNGTVATLPPCCDDSYKTVLYVAHSFTAAIAHSRAHRSACIATLASRIGSGVCCTMAASITV